MEPIGGIEAPYDSCYGVKGVGMEEGAQPVTGSSFTALLELPPTQAMELLHNVGGGASGADSPGNVLNRHRINHQSVYKHTLNCSPVFPSDAALIERAAKYSVFTNGGAALPGGGKDSPEWSSPPSNLSVKVKIEPADSNSNPNSSQQGHEMTAKRKERGKKGKGSSKKCKPEDEENLPYVHVRARRGQATDSHSLAERARRAKINARMKMLQELVPGCNKISGTSLVLDEIINHVQSLQRQVEYLSMRLAAVCPRVDFNLDSLLAGNGAFLDSNYQTIAMPATWPELQMNSNRPESQQQWHVQSSTQPIWIREEDHHTLITPESSLLSYGSPHSGQLKMGL